MELINKEDAVALITAEMDKIRTHSLVARINLRLAKNIIEDMPTIDIVRCKECYMSEVYQSDSNGVMARYCKAFTPIRMVADDDYCSYGCRKEE